jgi:hypothetical protein
MRHFRSNEFTTPVNPVNQKVDILGAELKSENENLADLLGLEKGRIMKQSAV